MAFVVRLFWASLVVHCQAHKHPAHSGGCRHATGKQLGYFRCCCDVRSYGHHTHTGVTMGRLGDRLCRPRWSDTEGHPGEAPPPLLLAPPPGALRQWGRGGGGSV